MPLHRWVARHVRSVVYGGLDGTITVFALVASTSGEGTRAVPRYLLLVMALANLLADALSMALGDYLSSKAETEVSEQKVAELQLLIARTPDQAVDRCVKRFSALGYTERQASQIAQLLATDGKAMAQVTSALENDDTDDDPGHGAFATFCSFVMFGSVPLCAYFFEVQNGLLLATVLTAVTLFMLGALKSQFGSRGMIASGIEVVMVGGLASFVAYWIANSLSRD